MAGSAGPRKGRKHSEGRKRNARERFFVHGLAAGFLQYCHWDRDARDYGTVSSCDKFFLQPSRVCSKVQYSYYNIALMWLFGSGKSTYSKSSHFLRVPGWPRLLHFSWAPALQWLRLLGGGFGCCTFLGLWLDAGRRQLSCQRPDARAGPKTSGHLRGLACGGRDETMRDHGR